MITINDIQAAIKKEADAARVLESAKAAHEAAQVTFNDVHGMDYHLTKLFCKRGDTNAETALASNEGENVRAAFDRYVSANERATVSGQYTRMLVHCFKVQVKQIVGAALDAHSNEWIDKPAHYKRTHAVLVSIAQDALKAAGVEGIRPYVYDNGAKGIMHDTEIRFTCSVPRVSFSSGNCECVDMQVRSWGDKDHNADTLYNENFTHWYGEYGKADALQVVAADVRRLARSYARDIKRIQRENARYNAAIDGIEDKYAFMGVRDDIYKARLIAHN